MKLEQVTRKEKDPNHKKRIIVSVRASQKQSDFMTEKNISPQLLFDQALIDLGFK